MSEPKFKVGDRVKITQKNSSNSKRFDGREAVIDRGAEGYKYLQKVYYGIDLDPGYGGIWEDELTLIPEPKLPTFPSARINREEGLVITNGVDIEAVIPSDFVSRYFEVEERDGHKALYVELLVSDIAFDSNAKKVD